MSSSSSSTKKSRTPVSSLRFGKTLICVGVIAFFVVNSLEFSSQQQIHFLDTMKSIGVVQKSSHVLPDWRMTTDCSAYSRDCVLRKLNGQSYAEYPFQFANKYKDRYEWQAKLPEDWKQSLKEHIPTDEVTSKPKDPAVQKCVRAAQQRSVEEQLESLLETLKRENNMVSFTISDYLYARDMMQDVFEMAHNIVGFKDSFFMVAMDIPTMEMACEFNYPFLAWPQENNNSQPGAALKKNVANSKFVISYELAKRGQSFFFFEMDVWFVKSPLPVLREQTEDILFSGHQNNPRAANIGVYSVIANERSEEYLRICIEILEQTPDTHDQVIMTQVYWFLDALKDKQPLKYSRIPEPHPRIPTFKHPATHGRFVPYQIAADERPVPGASTLAIHTLCGSPLRNPHGKKMIAKELGAWYGAGSYYGKGNRYLWLDGHVWNGFSMAMSWPGFHPWEGYHQLPFLQWTIAATVALARRTGRIWVMPKVLNDAGVHFIWTILDMESVESLVDVRETNFPVNPKAWHRPSVPFETVARTAVGNQGKIFAQPSAMGTSTNGILAWNSSAYENASPFDAWFAIHTAIPEIADAEVLLAGLPTMRQLVGYLHTKVEGKKELSIAEEEIIDVWKKLKWCEFRFRDRDLDKVVGRAAADWDCYLKGKPIGRSVPLRLL